MCIKRLETYNEERLGEATEHCEDAWAPANLQPAARLVPESDARKFNSKFKSEIECFVEAKEETSNFYVTGFYFQSVAMGCNFTNSALKS